MRYASRMLLRCQQTLGPIVERADGLYSPAADLLHPVEDGIVFMGYDEREADVTWRSRITRAIKPRALDTLRSGKRTRDPVAWLHEHLAGGDGYLVALARKAVAADRRRSARIRVVDPAGLVATKADRDVFIPLREVLDEAAKGLRS